MAIEKLDTESIVDGGLIDAQVLRNNFEYLDNKLKDTREQVMGEENESEQTAITKITDWDEITTEG